MPAKIAARGELGAAVTDCLLKRGSAAIQRMILENPNARSSENGFAQIIMRPRRRYEPCTHRGRPSGLAG